eukprot:COSAG02_NODE_43892_length_370_cov_2.081181_1_plen_107_part_01
MSVADSLEATDGQSALTLSLCDGVAKGVPGRQWTAGESKEKAAELVVRRGQSGGPKVDPRGNSSRVGTGQGTTSFPSRLLLTVRFLRGVCQVLRSAQRLPALHALFL